MHPTCFIYIISSLEGPLIKPQSYGLLISQNLKKHGGNGWTERQDDACVGVRLSESAPVADRPAAPSVPRAVADQKQMSAVIWGSSTGLSSLLHHCGVESRTHLFLSIYYNVHSQTSYSPSDCSTWRVKVFSSSSSDLWPLEHKDGGAFCFVPRRVFKKKTVLL